MKNIFTLCFLMVFSGMFSQEYFLKTSCNKKASEIANAAVEHMLNLEMPIALGMAKAALVLDEDCGCAQLTVSAISSNNGEMGGSRSQKLNDINIASLTDEERVWYNYQSAADRDERQRIVESAESKHPDSPFVAALRANLNPMNFAFYPDYAEKFPSHASFAYNMMSYGIMYGQLGEADYTEASKYIDKSLELHDGPNAFDSNAEHLASLGRYEDALQSQFKAVDFAAWGSVYGDRARIYWMKSNLQEVENSLQETVNKMMKGIRENNFEAFSEVISEDIQITMGDSSLGEFYEFSEESFEEATGAIKWNSTSESDFDYTFSPDMNSAVVTHKSDGSYTVDSSDEVTYTTRVSHVFTRTDDGWKLLHSHWSPRKGGQGIPDRD